MRYYPHVPDLLSYPARWLKAVLGRFSYLLDRRVAPKVAVKVRSEGLTYLDLPALTDLHECVVRADRLELPGILVEAGCAMGGSAIVMASARRSIERDLRIFDVFAQIPPPAEGDGEDAHERFAKISSGEAIGPQGTKYYGYESDLKLRVEAEFDRFGIPPATCGVELIEGLFEETLILSDPVDVAHIDCDWYDSVRVCLERIWPRLVPGGVIVIDDYEAWSGCKKAVDDFFASLSHQYRFDFQSRLHIIKPA